ncbi:probable magnesium transporter NIPA7, partial [Gossypium hirsutum]|uniref:Probable magnesium transporter n=1 Tax=Gossypium hirsutum TaxID=3635 RepID=A0ABM3AHJ5_GOSHI
SVKTTDFYSPFAQIGYRFSITSLIYPPRPLFSSVPLSDFLPLFLCSHSITPLFCRFAPSFSFIFFFSLPLFRFPSQLVDLFFFLFSLSLRLLSVGGSPGFCNCESGLSSSIKKLEEYIKQESPITSVQEIWAMATQPAFLLYLGSVIVLVVLLILYFAPRCGHTNVLVFTGICSLMGSLSVMSVKALGTALKLTFEGKNQLVYLETWFFMFIVATCVIIQMNYLNKALNTFNTAVVSPIYYVMFTSLTIIASVIMFKVSMHLYPLHCLPDSSVVTVKL